MDDRAITNGLKALRRPAPPGLLPAVLAGAGLADSYVRRPGPTGPLFVAFNEHGISAVRFAGDADEFEAAFEEEFGRPAVAVDHVPPVLHRRLDEALAGGRPGKLVFDLRELSEFAAAVLRKTAEIPSGEVRPYSWIAREIGRPGATRAVGTALNRNPVPVLIPCHRVVRADGSVGRYAYGPEVKRALLGAEGLDPGKLDEAAAAGIRFVGSDTTRIFCHLTCRAERRIGDAHRIVFRSAEAAAAAGYRPCRLCRPAAAA